MRLPFITPFLAGLFVFGVASAGAQETPLAKLERENRQLKLQLTNLNKSLAAALEREDAKTKALNGINKYLALRGKDLFENRDTKLLNAVADYEIARENLTELETASSNLLLPIQNYLRTAVASDPEARKAVEVKIRELEVALGQRKRPKRKIEQGTAQESRIVTIDSASGLAVINAGLNAEVSVGMRFRIERSGTHICDAVVAITRPNVSGLLLQPLINPEVPVQAGDFAKIIQF